MDINFDLVDPCSPISYLSYMEEQRSNALFDMRKIASYRTLQVNDIDNILESYHINYDDAPQSFKDAIDDFDIED